MGQHDEAEARAALQAGCGLAAEGPGHAELRDVAARLTHPLTHPHPRGG